MWDICANLDSSLSTRSKARVCKPKRKVILAWKIICQKWRDMLIFLHLVVTQLLMKTRYFMFLGVLVLSMIQWWFMLRQGGFLESFKGWSCFAGSQRTYWIFLSPQPIANNVTLPQQRNPYTIFSPKPHLPGAVAMAGSIVWADVFGTIATIDLLVKSVASHVNYWKVLLSLWSWFCPFSETR